MKTNRPWTYQARLLDFYYGRGHYIFIQWFLSIYLLSSFFLAWSHRPHIGCLPYFDTWCGPSANLECRSETCCARLAENAGPKKSPKIGHLGTITQLCRAISLQLRHVSTIGKKLVKQQYLLHMSPAYGELCPLAADINPVVWGTAANFNGLCVLAALLHSTVIMGVTKLCGVEHSAPPIFSRAAITLGISPDSNVAQSSWICSVKHFKCMRYLFLYFAVTTCLEM